MVCCTVNERRLTSGSHTTPHDCGTSGEEHGKAVQIYNGVYDKQATLVNGRDLWQLRRDFPAKYAETGTTLYWSDSTERWVVEAPTVTWEAPNQAFNAAGDVRQFPGLQDYSGAEWEVP